MNDILLSALSRFGKDELISMIPSEGREIILTLSGVSSEVDINNENLALVIKNSFAENILFDSSLRNRLIDSFNTEELKIVFPEDSNFDNVDQFFYQYCHTLADNDLEDFAKRVGLEDCYYQYCDVKKKKVGIKRVRPAFGLFEYQALIADKIDWYFKNNEKRILMHLPTGSGKTRVAINVIVEHLRDKSDHLVIWLADREELCQQAFDTFINAWSSLGKYDCSAYGLYSDSNESISGIDSGFVVISIQKMLLLKKSNKPDIHRMYLELRKNVSLLVFDEAHKIIAPEYKGLVDDLTLMDGNIPVLGLSATPGRKFSIIGLSDEDYQLSSFFNSKKITMNVVGYLSPIEFLTKNNFLANVTFIPLEYYKSDVLSYSLKKFKLRSSEVLDVLSKNDDRNNVVLNTVIQEANRGSKIIVFAASVEHANSLAIALTFLGVNAMSVDSKNDNTQSRRLKIKKYIDGKLQVLTNYNVLTAGFDAPQTNVVVIGRPVQSLVQYMQMAGRAMRGIKNGGNLECKIYTVMDDIPEYRNICEAFRYWDKMWINGEEDE